VRLTDHNPRSLLALAMFALLALAVVAVFAFISPQNLDAGFLYGGF